MKTRGALFLCFVFSWFSGQASMEFNKRVSDAYLQIIHLELDKGHSILQDEVKQNPSNHLVLLYDNYIDFLKAFISEERNLYERFEKNYSARYEKIEDEKADTPWRLYALAEMKMQEAFLKIKFGEFKTSTLGMRAAYKLLEKNKRLYPSFLLNNKNLGMIHVVLGSVPSDYRWLIKLAGMKGTIPQGMKEINDTWSEIQKTDLSVYEEEILFYLSTIQSSLNVPAVEMKKTMAAIRPFTTVNPLMQYCYINLCIRSGNSRQALDMPGDSPSTRFPFHFLNYKKGTLLLFKLDMEAEHYFKLFLEKILRHEFY